MSADSAPAVLLQNLKQDFERFRSCGRRRARIPDGLRRRVVAASSAGISSSVLSAELGVGSSQLAAWRSSITPALCGQGKPRILAVTADTQKSAPQSSLRISCESGRLLVELTF